MLPGRRNTKTKMIRIFIVYQVIQRDAEQISQYFAYSNIRQ